jgi:hypothetical protein
MPTAACNNVRAVLSVTAAMLLLCGLGWAQVEAVRPPAEATAGSAVTMASEGSGEGELYLVGPDQTSVRKVRLGESIQLEPGQIKSAGRYIVILCAGKDEGCRSASFWVEAEKVASLSFIVHPSRVPVGRSDAISGVVFPFDRYQNLVMASSPVQFRLTAGGKEILSRDVTTAGGVAWLRTSSGKNAGRAELSASIGEVTARRVVHEVASEPCNLRIKAGRSAKGLSVETDPVRDCAGNPVPDGTIVTFTKTDAAGKATVDAPTKRGIARAEMTSTGSAVISVASGVVMGNELRVGEGR